ncbi:MAG: T9SS type A sorting domain-containing protein [Bacteroidales bacterium]
MEIHILLISFLCFFPCSVQTQVQQRKVTFHSGPEKAGFSVNPPQSGFKPERMVVPAKRNMFDSSGYVWKWDTIFCYKTSGSAPYYRVTRKYSSSGDSLVQLMDIRQSSFVYVNYARESFTFDSAGNWLSYLSEKWENNAWVNQSAKKFVYNSNGDMVDWKETWWQNNTWVNDWHNYRHFDANGLNDTSLSQTGQDSLWVNYSLYIQSYDANGYRISAVGSTWINNGWSVTNLDTFTNNSNGNLLTYLRQVWENSSWVNSSLSTMTYDTAGNKLSGLNQQWQNNAWENNHLSSYVYDGNGNNILYTSQNWSGGAWVNQNRMLYLYDTSNNMLSQTSQGWNISSWQNQATQQYTYDIAGNSLTGKYLWWYQNTWQPYDGSLQVFADHQGDDYINLIEVYRYEAVLDSIMVFTEPDPSQGQFTLYPNPSHSMIYISSLAASTGSHGSLTLYDLRGQLVLTKQVVNETTGIDISGLIPGVYFVRFSDNRMTRVLKFVKD